ncbi:hypothetical protein HDU82_000728 [Entophlyctis luteolus]|nr:hypothetical protein HDU82_000728 [Entophlyctis luteolus]
MSLPDDACHGRPRPTDTDALLLLSPLPLDTTAHAHESTHDTTKDTTHAAHADHDPVAALRADLALLRIRGAVQNNPLLRRAASNNSIVPPAKQPRPVSVISVASVASSHSPTANPSVTTADQACPPPAFAANPTLPGSPQLHRIVPDFQVLHSTALQTESSSLATGKFCQEFAPPQVADTQKLPLGHQRQHELHENNSSHTGAEISSVCASPVQAHSELANEDLLRGADSIPPICPAEESRPGSSSIGDLIFNENCNGSCIEVNVNVNVEQSSNVPHSPPKMSPLPSSTESSSDSHNISKSPSKFAHLFDKDMGPKNGTIVKQDSDSLWYNGMRGKNNENLEFLGLEIPMAAEYPAEIPNYKTPQLALSDITIEGNLMKNTSLPAEKFELTTLQNHPTKPSHIPEKKEISATLLGSQPESELFSQIMGAFDHDWFSASSITESSKPPEAVSIPAPDLELDPSMQNYVSKCVNLFSHAPEESATKTAASLADNKVQKTFNTETLDSATAPHSVTWTLKRLTQPNVVVGKLITSSSDSTLNGETEETSIHALVQTKQLNSLTVTTTNNLGENTPPAETRAVTLEDSAASESLSNLDNDPLRTAVSSGPRMIVDMITALENNDAPIGNKTIDRGRKNTRLFGLWRSGSAGSIFSSGNSIGIWGIPNRSAVSGRKSVNWGLARFGQLQQTKLSNPEAPVIKPKEVDVNKNNGVLFFKMDNIDEIVVPNSQKITVNITLIYNQNEKFTIPQVTFDPAKNSTTIPVDFECVLKLPSNDISGISSNIDAIVKIAPVIAQGSNTPAGLFSDFQETAMSRNASRLKPQISHSKSMILPSIFRGAAKGSGGPGAVGSGLSKLQAIDAQKRLPLGEICTAKFVLIENVREFAEVADGVVREHVWNARVSSGADLGLAVKLRLNMRTIGAVQGAACGESFIPENFQEALSGIELKALHDSVEIKGYMFQIGGGLQEWKRRYFELKGCVLSAYDDSSRESVLMQLDVSRVQTIRSSCVIATISRAWAERRCSRLDSGILGRKLRRTRTAASKANDCGTPSSASAFEIVLNDARDAVQFSTRDEPVAAVSGIGPALAERWWRVFADDHDCGDGDCRKNADEDGQSRKEVLEQQKKPENAVLDDTADFEDVCIGESKSGCHSATGSESCLVDSSTQATKHWLYALAFAASVIDPVPEWLRFR